MTSPDTPWLLAEPAAGVQLLAESDGIWLRGPDLVGGHPPHRAERTPPTRLGRLLPTVIPQLYELGLATRADDGVHMAYADFTTLETHGIDAFTDMAPWAPFTLELADHRWLGAADFRYNYRFYLGLRHVPLIRRGCFVRQGTTIYQLDTQTFAMLEAIDTFNTLPADAKTSPEAFLRFATVKGLAEGVGAQLDRYLAEERVLVPSRVGLDLIVEDEGRISFAPKIDGVESDTMRQAFFALDNVETVYALDDSGGGRLRVVLDEQQREVLRRMQRVRHLSGAERTAVLRAPQAVFDGVAEAIDVDPAVFGPRVQGVGISPSSPNRICARSAASWMSQKDYRLVPWWHFFCSDSHAAMPMAIAQTCHLPRGKISSPCISRRGRHGIAARGRSISWQVDPRRCIVYTGPR